MAYKDEMNEKPTPPRIPSHEEQFDMSNAYLDGWTCSYDCHEGTGGHAFDGKRCDYPNCQCPNCKQ
jgi:hypothetical protein